MRRRRFTIFAGLSLLLSVVAGCGWALSYYQPWSRIVYRDGETQMPSAPTPKSRNSALVLENRAGRLVVLHQWITLQRLPEDPQQTYPDVSRPREGRIAVRMIAPKPGQGASYGSGWGVRVPDPLESGTVGAIRIWLHPAGFSYEQYKPGAVRLVASVYDNVTRFEPVLVTGDPSPMQRALMNNPRDDFVGYRQLMLPHWLFVTLGVVPPLLWLWARRGRHV